MENNQMKLILRLVVGGYLVYLAYDLFQTSQGKLMFMAAAALFAEENNGVSGAEVGCIFEKALYAYLSKGCAKNGILKMKVLYRGKQGLSR